MKSLDFWNSILKKINKNKMNLVYKAYQFF